MSVYALEAIHFKDFLVLTGTSIAHIVLATKFPFTSYEMTNKLPVNNDRVGGSEAAGMEPSIQPHASASHIMFPPHRSRPSPIPQHNTLDLILFPPPPQ